MCGIYCQIDCTKHKPLDSARVKKVLKLLKCRGPDASYSLTATTCNDKLNIHMIGNTLWTQGKKPTEQPIDLDYGALLLNGDVYVENWNEEICDTKELMEKLNPEYLLPTISSEEKIIHILRSLNGPFSLIYWDKLENKLYFCRDHFGRKSLLLHVQLNEIVLSSVLGKTYSNAAELPVGSIFCLNLENKFIKEYHWAEGDDVSESIPIEKWFRTLFMDVPLYKVASCVTTELDDYLLEKIDVLSQSTPCRITFLKSVLKMEDKLRKTNELIDILSNSVKIRVKTQPGFCKMCIDKSQKCSTHCTVGILFSGGLDCTILAALAHRHVPITESIDLLNVAFEHENCNDFQVPDRLTSLQSFEELKSLFPQRMWNLVQINITADELKEKVADPIGNLVYPCQTILDESLGSALWFAARGKASDYESPCRILLVGMGADELFGGYTRHRNVFNRKGWTALENEMRMDWARLPYRNLSRDDRVMSHHGRQPRMPYLDEQFVKFVLDMNPWERCYPNNNCGPGTGDKMLLRLAAVKLGLERTSVFPKKAIQFGSKIANKKDNAKDISPNLL